MAVSDQQLRIRVTDETSSHARSIQVLDADDNVLGDLSKSVGSVTYRMGVGGAVGTVQIELAVEIVEIDTIAIPGMNAPAPAPVKCTHRADRACANCSPLHAA